MFKPESTLRDVLVALCAKDVARCAADDASLLNDGAELDLDTSVAALYDGGKQLPLTLAERGITLKVRVGDEMHDIVYKPSTYKSLTFSRFATDLAALFKCNPVSLVWDEAELQLDDTSVASLPDVIRREFVVVCV
jgi:hypothetical protein